MTLRFAALGGITLALALLAPLLPVAQPTLLAATTVGGLAGGSILVALVGRLLSRDWLRIIEDELLPAGLTLLVALVWGGAALIGSGTSLPHPAWALPPASPGSLWFAPAAVVARLVLFSLLGAGIALTLALARSGRYRIAATAAPLFAAIFAFVTIDWVTLRPPVWWTALQPVGYVVNQMTAALALAFVFHLVQGERANEGEFSSLATALISLALLDLWIGYVQYLIAWYGNLPSAAAYYLARTGIVPAALPLAAAAQALGALILLLKRTRRLMLVSSVLILAAHLLHMTWLAAPHLPGSLAGWAWLALLLATWTGWVAALAQFYDARLAPRRSAGAPVLPPAFPA